MTYTTSERRLLRAAVDTLDAIKRRGHDGGLATAVRSLRTAIAATVGERSLSRAVTKARLVLAEND